MDKELLSIILMIILIFVILALIAITNNQELNKKIKDKILQDLLQLEELLKTKNPIVYRDILIRLDSLLSKSLQLKMKNKEACGKNLKKAKDIFEKGLYNDIWTIHKLRNEVVHENKEITYNELENGYKVIKKAIRILL